MTDRQAVEEGVQRGTREILAAAKELSKKLDRIIELLERLQRFQ